VAKSRRLPDAAADSHSVTLFLRSVGRRWLLRQSLLFLLVASVVHVGLLVATQLANRALALELPRLATAPLIFLVLLAGALARRRPERLAWQADRVLGLKDRLSSFLDLGARRDVDERYRGAQARETASALAAVDPRGAVAVPPWLWAGPPLFLWLIYTSYFSVFLPQPLQFVRQLRLAVSGSSGRPGDGDRAGAGANRAVADAHRGDASPKPAPAPQAPPAEKAALSQPPHDAPAPKPGDPAAAGTPPAAAEAPLRGSPAAGGPTGLPQPARLFSVPLTAALTPVGADALAPAGGAPRGAAAPQGRVAFNLVPGRGAGGGAIGPGSGQGKGAGGGFEVVVDFAALPADVREPVRRYFEGLSHLFTGGMLGTR